MNPRSAALRLLDIIEAIERVQTVMADLSLEAYETDLAKAVGRGARTLRSFRRPAVTSLMTIKTRHPEIPWKKVAGIGNVLRHDYESVAAPIIWKLARIDLGLLEQACRDELRALRDSGLSD